MIVKYDEHIMKMLQQRTIESMVIPTNKRKKAFISALITNNQSYMGPKMIGYNQRKTHPFQHKYSKHPEAIFLHAEVDAIKRYISFYGNAFSETTLYVCRMRYDGPKKSNVVTGFSRPCVGCMRCIATFEIPRVIYSTDVTGEYEELLS